MAKSVTMNGSQRAMLDPDGEVTRRQPVEIERPREMPVVHAESVAIIEVPLLDSLNTDHRASHIEVRLYDEEHKNVFTRLWLGLVKNNARLNPTELYPFGQMIEKPPQVIKWILEEMSRSTTSGR